MFGRCCCAEQADSGGPGELNAPSTPQDMVKISVMDEPEPESSKPWSDIAVPDGPKEIKVILEKGEKGTSAGIELDMLGLQFAQVCAVVPSGLVQAYNDTVDPEKSVHVGDFIVQVNGVRGDVRRMTERFQQDQVIEMIFARPLPFKVTINQTPGALLNCVKCAPTGVSLLVVRTGEALKQWNDLNPERAVKIHDCITSVNGQQGDTKLMVEQAEHAADLEIEVARPEAA